VITWNGETSSPPDVAAYRRALLARLVGAWHLVRGHRVRWHRMTGGLRGGPGEIVCESCRHRVWTRADDPWRGGPAPRRS